MIVRSAIVVAVRGIEIPIGACADGEIESTVGKWVAPPELDAVSITMVIRDVPLVQVRERGVPVLRQIVLVAVGVAVTGFSPRIGALQATQNERFLSVHRTHPCCRAHQQQGRHAQAPRQRNRGEEGHGVWPAVGWVNLANGACACHWPKGQWQREAEMAQP